MGGVGVSPERKDFSKREILFLILTILGIIFSAFFVAVRGNKIINSDSAAEIILGNLLAKDGGILSKDWYYPTEIRILRSQVVFKLFFLLFPNDWHLVRVLSYIVMGVILAGSAVFAGRESLRSKIPFAAVVLSWPFCQWYAFNVTYGLFYIPPIVLDFLCIAFFYRLTFNGNIRAGKLKYIIDAFFFASVSFVAGLGGVRYMLTVYCPLIIAVVVYFMIARTKAYSTGAAVDERAYARKMAVVFGATAFYLIGYIINRLVLLENYNFLSLSEDTWRDFSLESILLVLSNSLRLMGWNPGVPIMSWQGFANFVCLAFMALFVFCVVRLFIRFSELPERIQFLFVFSLSAYLLNLVVMSMDRTSASYWIPIMPFIFLFFDMELETEDAKFCVANRTPAVILMTGSILLSSFSVFASPKSSELGGEPEKVCAVADFIKNEGYTQGFANFWYSDAVVELTDGKVEMWTVEDPNSGVDDLNNISTWNQITSHSETLPEGDFFVITEIPYEYDNASDYMVYSENDVYVYVFDNMECYRAIAD